MKKYIAIYKTLIKLNFSTLTTYRSNFINSMLSAIAWGGFTILSVVILTMRTNQAFGWRREEIILLTGAYSILIGIFHTLFSRNFERMSRIVHLGQLDYILVKPADPQFLLSFSIINFTTLIRIPLGLAIIVYLITKLHITINLLNILWFVLLLLVGLVLLYSIWYMVVTLTIWFTRLSNIVELMYSVSSISRYPREMIAQLYDFVFLFLMPLTFIINSPVKFLLNKGTWVEAFILVGFAVLFLYISRTFWKFSLRFYTSASS